MDWKNDWLMVTNVSSVWFIRAWLCDISRIPCACQYWRSLMVLVGVTLIFLGVFLSGCSPFLRSSKTLVKKIKTQAQKAAILAGCLNDVGETNIWGRKQNKKYIRQCAPDNDIWTRNKSGNIKKKQTNVRNNWDESSNKTVLKTNRYNKPRNLRILRYPTN